MRERLEPFHMAYATGVKYGRTVGRFCFVRGVVAQKLAVGNMGGDRRGPSRHHLCCGWIADVHKKHGTHDKGQAENPTDRF